MKRHVVGVSAACIAVCMSAVAHAQQNQFPLAARAGVDSKAREVAPSGAVNQGPFDMNTWKYGNAFTPPPGAKIWNPAKIKLMTGGKLVGGTHAALPVLRSVASMKPRIDRAPAVRHVHDAVLDQWGRFKAPAAGWPAISKAIRTMSARSTSCMTPPSRPA
jgi:hypothetical protein